MVSSANGSQTDHGSVIVEKKRQLAKADAKKGKVVMELPLDFLGESAITKA